MTINKVSKIGSQIDFGAGVVQIQAPQAEEAIETPEATAKAEQTEASSDAGASETTAATSSSSSDSAPVMNGDVRLKFIVDSKTNDVTVLVLDKASRQIIRTIPTDELNNLTQGDLVTIFA